MENLRTIAVRRSNPAIPRPPRPAAQALQTTLDTLTGSTARAARRPRRSRSANTDTKRNRLPDRSQGPPRRNRSPAIRMQPKPRPTRSRRACSAREVRVDPAAPEDRRLRASMQPTRDGPKPQERTWRHCSRRSRPESTETAQTAAASVQATLDSIDVGKRGVHGRIKARTDDAGRRLHEPISTTFCRPSKAGDMDAAKTGRHHHGAHARGQEREARWVRPRRRSRRRRKACASLARRHRRVVLGRAVGRYG